MTTPISVHIDDPNELITETQCSVISSDSTTSLLLMDKRRIVKVKS